MRINDYISELETLLIKNAKPENTYHMQRYMKNKFLFYGIKTPDRKAITSKYWKKRGYPDMKKIIGFVQLSWKKPQREWQYIAIDLLIRQQKRWEETLLLPTFSDMIIHRSWWDTVDAIASRLVGNYFLQFPRKKIMTIKQWCNSNNLWLQRTSIIFQLLYKEHTDVELLTKCVLRHKNSDEFFLQKAIGWALRQYARVNPGWVIDFVQKNTFKPLSYREATKHLKLNK